MDGIDYKTIIEAEQLKQLLSLSARRVLVALLLVVMIVVVQAPVVPKQINYIWLIVNLFVSLIRIVMGHYFSAYPATNPQDVRMRLNMFRGGLIASAALWGVDSFFVIGTHHIEIESFATYALVGVCAGSMVCYSIDRISALSYLCFAIGPFLCLLMFQEGGIYKYMFFSGLVYAVFVTVNILRFNETLLESIKIRHDATLREAQIRELAFYDQLTGLPNRRLLLDRMRHALTVSARTQKNGALLFMDVDKFKALNDTYGHDVGDLLLKQIADRIKATVRTTDTVARLGGDEFVVMIEHLSTDVNAALEDTRATASKIMDNLRRPFQLGKVEFNTTASIGIAMFIIHGKTDSELLKNADKAMYLAKKTGRNQVVMFAD